MRFVSLYFYGPIMLIDDLVDYGEPEACALLFCGVMGMEQPVFFFFRDSRPQIGDFDVHPLLILVEGSGYLNFPFFFIASIALSIRLIKTRLI